MLKNFICASALAVSMIAPALAQDPLAERSTPELGWREDDDEASFRARLVAAARPSANSCDADKAALAALASAFQVGADQSGVAGKPVGISWLVEHDAVSVPTRLVVAVDGPVRFAGEGFYGLMPGAMAPFGLPDGQNRTRVLVALSGEGAPRDGSFGIVPLDAGSLDISVSVAALVCGEAWSQVVAAGAVPVSVSPEAVFSVDDPFSFAVPKDVIASPDGLTRVETFDGRYRLVDEASGAVLADREGSAPHYSPTGRFLVAQLGEGIELLDAVDGAVLGEGAFGDIGWENRDSFMIVGQPSLGAIVLRNPPVEQRTIAANLDCTACPAMAARLNIDLENDMALRVGGQGFAVTRLSGVSSDVIGSIDTFDEEMISEALAEMEAAAAAVGAVPLFIPEHWNFRGGPRFTAFSEEYEATGAADFDHWIERMKAAMVPAVSKPAAAPSPPQELAVSEIGQWRGAAPLARPRAVPDRLPSRLAEFGIRMAEPGRPAFRKAGPLDEDGDLRIAQRIEATVPWARGMFAKMEFGCVPEDSTEQSPKIYAFFNDAMEFRVGTRSVWLTLFSCKWTAGGAFEQNFYLFDSAAPGLRKLGTPNPQQPNGGRCDYSISTCGFDAGLFGNRLVVWSRQSQTYLVYDLGGMAVTAEHHRLVRGELMREMRYSEADGTLVQLNDDDSFVVYDAAAGTTLLEGRYVDDEIVAWSPDLRFDSTAEGANYVSLRFPGQAGAFTFQQFRNQLRKEGHVARVIGRTYAAEPLSIRVPPGLLGSLELEDGRVSGTLDVRDAVELRVYQDGLRTDTLAVSGTGKYDLDVAHVPGARWVSIVAADAVGLASRPLGRDVSSGTAARPVVHALTVGIDTYDAPELADLRFAGADAGTLRQALASIEGSAIGLGVAENLADAAATPQAILARARAIVETAKQGDTVVFSFAGHGLTAPDGRFFMATSATEPQAIERTALAWDDLAAVLVTSKARVVVFLDACHSGAAGTGLFATNDDAAEGLLDRVPSGLLVFSAAKGRQLSEEMVQVGGGVFTNAVADVIARERGVFDLDRNGAIEASELYAGVKRRVSELTEGRQVPWLARNELVGDFALF